MEVMVESKKRLRQEISSDITAQNCGAAPTSVL